MKKAAIESVRPANRKRRFRLGTDRHAAIGLATAFSSLTGYFNNGATFPMMALVGICGIAAFLALDLLIGVRGKQKFAVAEEHITFG